MANMRSLAIAIEARAEKQKTYAIGSRPVSPTAREYDELTPISLDELERELVPTYLKNMPRRDGWGNELEVRVGVKSYAIRSRGSDGREGKLGFNRAINGSFEEDLLFNDGNWIQYVEGI